MARFHLVKGDGADIGFATTCLISGVITFSEFKDWLHYVIENSTDVPGYIFDILDCKEKFDYTLRARPIVGFDPAWDATSDELTALEGVGFIRFPDFNTDASSKEQALEALERNRHVEGRFRELFPFIQV